MHALSVLLKSAELASLEQAPRVSSVSAPAVQISQGSSQPDTNTGSSTWQPILSKPATQAVPGPSPPAAHMSTAQCPRAAERLGSWGRESPPKASPRAVERMGVRGPGQKSGSPRSAAAERQWEVSLEERLYSEHRRRLHQGQVPEVKPGSAMLDDSDDVSPNGPGVPRRMDRV